ncbi:MAG TPA: alpha/beta family hydrolase [Methylibium sp.]|uniref:alpha/beta hydrolase family protein n=1 Tax=Methylibium sp. TaxID=2067992 RepID=UPI002DBD56E8|nr:alpha/beta family hydrolase [Methylibium sp.]HEU4460870.1 alpha/beta family hydrolase [Methylibium sp.]
MSSIRDAMNRRTIHEHALAVTDEAGLAVSALLTLPAEPSACYVFAHGAGAGMAHPFMHEVAHGLAARGVATLRYQFPSMERGSKRPDVPAVAHRAVRAAVAAASRSTRLPLIAGGKSFGGRMTSQAQAFEPLANVRGLVFLGFPLHAPDKPSVERAKHLADVAVPMLFVQGTRDKLAPVAGIEAVTASLQDRATLLLLADADHGFDVLVRSGRTHEEVMAQLLDGVSAWVTAVMGGAAA